MLRIFVPSALSSDRIIIFLNEEEIEYGTDPANKDTDDDEVSDAEEIMVYETDTLDATDYPE